MLRSRHWYGYGSLVAVVLALACFWWCDRSRSSSQADQLDDQIDHLVGELRKRGESIERMPGGFRRTYGQVPPSYRIGPAVELPASTVQPLLTAAYAPGTYSEVVPSAVKPLPAAPIPDANPKVVYLEVVVVETDITKLNTMGLILDALISNSSKDQSEGKPTWHQFLLENGYATRLNRPCIATVSGRTASIHVGGTNLQLIPHVLDSGDIRVDASIDLTEEIAGQTTSHFALTATTDVQPGQSHCLARVSTRRPNEKNQVQDYCTVVMLSADTRPPADLQVSKIAPLDQEAKVPAAAGTQRR